MSSAGIPPKGTTVSTTTTTTTTAAPVSSFVYADRYTEATLAVELAKRLAGRPTDGSSAQDRKAPAPGRVIWVDAGSEVVLYLDSIKIRLADGYLVFSIDMECDQSGRSALIVVLAAGKLGDPAGLFAVTDELPRGNAVLAARWGAILQNAVWGALTSLVDDYAAERGAIPTGFAATASALALVADTLAGASLSGVKK